MHTLRLLLFLLAASTLLAACSHEATTDQASSANNSTASADSIVVLSDVEIKNAGIDFIQPVVKNISDEITLNGEVDVPPQNLISISCPLGGFLKYTHLLPGDHVKKGEVIATLEDPQFIQLQQDYLTARARLQFLKQELERQQALSETQATSLKNYQQTLRDYETEKIQMEALASKLRLIHIHPEQLSDSTIQSTIRLYSPIDGYIARVNVNIGKYVMPTDVLFDIVDPRDLHAAMTVFQEDINRFRIGTRGEVYTTSQPGRQYPVEVVLITRNVDSNRTGILHCHFLKSPDRLLPGMYLTGTFTLAEQRQVTVPEDAVVHYQGKDYVFIQDTSIPAGKTGYRLVLTPVQTGKTENGWVALPNVDSTKWKNYRVAAHNAFAILGKMKNKIED